MTALASLLLAGALYGWGVVTARRAGRPFALPAVAAYALGLAVAAASLIAPVDDLADASLAWHMIQHLVLVTIVAPLLLLGAPLRLALAALPPRRATAVARVLHALPVRVLAHPAFAWLQFAFVLYATHLSPLYETALENPAVHAGEHALYVISALVFWNAVLAVPPAPHAASHPVRILMLFLALPMSAFLGFALYVSGYALYGHYAGRPGALEDQMNAGAVMWLAGGGPLLVALLWCVADWGARERKLESVADAGR